MTDLAEHTSLGVQQFQPTIQLGLHHAVLGGQIVSRSNSCWSTALLRRPAFAPNPFRPPCPTPGKGVFTICK